MSARYDQLLIKEFEQIQREKIFVFPVIVSDFFEQKFIQEIVQVSKFIHFDFSEKEINYEFCFLDNNRTSVVDNSDYSLAIKKMFEIEVGIENYNEDNFSDKIICIIKCDRTEKQLYFLEKLAKSGSLLVVFVGESKDFSLPENYNNLFVSFNVAFLLSGDMYE